MEIFEDLRYGLRALSRNRTVAAAAVLSLALGVGANATIFTLLNAILLRPLPVEDPSMLAAVHTLDAHNPGLLLCSLPNYLDYRGRNTVFSSLLLYTTMSVSLTGRGDPQLLIGQLVSANYFSVLGVSPVMGRGFLPEEDAAPGARPVAVLSYRKWTREFGSDPGIASRTITLNGRPYQVVGVAPPGFGGLNELYGADVWVPAAMYPQLYPLAAWVNQRRALLFAVVGRLKPSVGLAQAEAAMQVLARDLALEYPGDNGGRRIRLTSVSAAALAPPTRSLVTSAGTVLMIVSALVLLIACANVANLLLSRATGRHREIAVRLAMGASRWRLIRQLLVESLLLAAAGGGAGLAFAVWARDVVWAMRPSVFQHAGIRLDLDVRVLAYTFAVALLTALLFGLAPALRATRADLATDLKERTGQPASPRGRLSPRSLLVVGQVAFSVVALVGAGLFVRSIRHAGRLDLGFDAAHLASVSFNVADQGYDEARGREYQRRALEVAASTPGVLAASLARDLPLNVSAARTVLLDGQESTTSGNGRVTLTSLVWPGYFRTLGIPMMRGRDFSPRDNETGPRVVIVNQAAAAHFWPGQDAVGKRLHFFGDSRPAEVVGVAHNACYREIGEQPPALLYLSLVQYYFPTGGVYIRTSGDPEMVAATVRRAMQPLDRNLLLESESFARTIRESLWVHRLSAWLLAVFGILALLLAAVGIYGVVSYSVNRRVREIGVRMAMGATVGDVRLMILREGLGPVVLGVAAGVLIAMGASRWVAGMLLATGARDALTFVLVPAALTLVAVLACWMPARRATRIGPSAALRDE